MINIKKVWRNNQMSIDKEYENGRVTCISDTELAKLATAEYDKYKKGMEE